MATTTPHAWTMDSMIEWYLTRHPDIPPFSPDERMLALCVAQAWYFAHFLEELRGRSPHDSPEWGALWWGLWKVLDRRGTRPTSHHTTA
jgi:hypothetical protein